MSEKKLGFSHPQVQEGDYWEEITFHTEFREVERKKKDGPNVCAKFARIEGSMNPESLHVNTQPCTVRSVMWDSASESVLRHITLGQTTGTKRSPSVVYL